MISSADFNLSLPRVTALQHRHHTRGRAPAPRRGEADDKMSGRSHDRQRQLSCPPAGSYMAVSGQSPVAADSRAAFGRALTIEPLGAMRRLNRARELKIEQLRRNPGLGTLAFVIARANVVFFGPPAPAIHWRSGWRCAPAGSSSSGWPLPLLVVDRVCDIPFEAEAATCSSRGA
jgi:hypothetical protein